MTEILFTKLYDYMVRNNPELILSLNEQQQVTDYIKNKISAVTPLMEQMLLDNTPGYIVEEQCMDALTIDLRPSKFNYILDVLEEEFLEAYRVKKETGVLFFEIINILEQCGPVFELVSFNEQNEDDRKVRYAITEAIGEYLA